MAALVAGVALVVASPAAAAPGDILIGDYNAFGGLGGVIRVSPVSGARTTVSENTAPVGGPAFSNPSGIAVAANGDILVADPSAFGGGGAVIRVNPVSGARTTLSANTAPAGGPNFDDPVDVAVAANGDILVVDDDAFDTGGGVIRVNPVSGVRTTVSANTAPAGAPTFFNPNGIAVAPNGDILVVDPNALPGGAVIRVNLASGARTTVSQNAAPAGGPSFVAPAGIAVAPNGDIFVADQNAFNVGGSVIRVNPVSGARTLVSDNTMPAGGPSFADPVGITMAANGDILVADEEAFGGSGGVIRVNPVSGARTAVSENTAPPGGPSFVDPLGIAIEGQVEAPPPPPQTRPQCSDTVDNDGDGAIDLADPGCLRGPQDDNESDETLGDLSLCGQRRISLVRADARGRRVRLSGFVATALARRQVTISVGFPGRPTTLKRVTPKADGRFTATVGAPPKRLFSKARYQASVGGSRSVKLKLPQSLETTSARRVGQTIVLRGRIKRALLPKQRQRVVIRRLLCAKSAVVGSAKPNARGVYVVRFAAPVSQTAALYRAETRVRPRPRSKRLVKQFARAIGVALR